MKLYNYEFWTSDSNASIAITIRTDKGQDAADDEAYKVLESVINSQTIDWWVEESSVEDF